MAHELEMINGKASMFYVGATPWHGLGTKIENGFILPEEAMSLAGLNWNVTLEDIFTADGTKVPKAKVTRRDSDGTILGCVGDRYHPLQNKDAFQWFAPFIESKQASFETAGSLRGGKVVWVLAKTSIENAEVVKGDTVESYILLSNSFDGTVSIKGGFTNTRTVCANTLSMAHNSASSKLLKLKHTRSASLTLEKVRETMNIAAKEFNATIDQYRFLASKAISKKDLEKYITVVMTPEGKEDSELRASTIERIEMIFENGKGMNENTRNYWGAYNSISEALTWHNSRSQDNRIFSLWFGQGQNINAKALQIATDMASGK